MSIEKPKVAIVIVSDSDLPVARKAIEVLKAFEVNFEVSVISAHRTPDRAAEYAKNAEKNGIEVIISAAGKAAHLPGVLAAFTTLPVIGIPIKSSNLDGLDSLLSIVQMPSGIPVATVAIDGAENAGILAVQILSLKYGFLKERLNVYKEKMRQEVTKKDERVKKEIF